MTRPRIEKAIYAEQSVITACQHGATITEAAATAGISESTATRIVRAARSRGVIIHVRRGRPRLSRAIYEPPAARPAVDAPSEQALIVICRDLRAGGFPYPAPLAPEEIAQEIAKLHARTLTIREQHVEPRVPLGIRVCSPFFPNRYRARWKKTRFSAVDAWQNLEELRKAVLFQLRYGDPITPPRVLRAITLRCRTPTIFRPSVAQFVFARYAPQNGRVWDPCAGYGGRLLGAHVAGVEYIGTEVDEETVRGNHDLSTALNARAAVHHIAAEDFDPPDVDLVFTSPPYWDRERYSPETAQSWHRHGTTFEAWWNGFWTPVLTRAASALARRRGHLVINIADLRENGRVLPLVGQTIACADRLGFDHVETLLMPLAAINRTRPAEPILVFRKRRAPLRASPAAVDLASRS